MLRGLVIRQLFIVVDIVLGACVVVTAAFVVLSLLREPADARSFYTTSAQPSAGARLNVPDPREAYESIINSGVFGSAGVFDPAEPPPPPPVVVNTSITETALNLTLHGVMATYPDDPNASAIIEDKESGQPMLVVGVGKPIIDKVTLKEVHPRYVIITNNRGAVPKEERLTLFEDDVIRLAAAPPAPAPPTGSGELPNAVYLNQAEIAQEINANYADLMTKVRPEYVRDNSGQIIGLTANNISNIPLAQKLHLRDGDVLQSINNEMIDSEQKIYELFMKYQAASSFRVGIMRDGKPQVVTYRLR